MKRFLAIVFLIIILVAVWFLFFRTEKTTVADTTASTKTNVVKKHSPQFDAQLGHMINAYMGLKNAFVDADTAAIRLNTTAFITATDSVNLSELHQSDSSLAMTAQQNLSDIKSNAEPILREGDIQEMRHDFSMVSENLYPLLKTIGYDGQMLYWQNCPMAFGDGKPANWLSKTSEIQNPYLGRKDPVYKSSMVGCGENVDSIFAK